ncbi:MAG: pyroglutamyl-peptidase I [Bdellovibrionaceae bacterium]|nr:pyroglutamyl-peptidase I [Pseudobdellovibrionaceae bacterium]
MTKILLTGFEPFHGHPKNPSQMLVEALQKEGFSSVVLPVSWSRLPSALDLALKEAGPVDFVLMLGLAAGRSGISLERVALNWQESPADEDGEIRDGLFIEPAAPQAIISGLPLRKWAQELTASGVPTEVSFSAGAFLCNFLYWTVLRRGLSGLFVHVPQLPEQARAGEPAMAFERQLSGIRRLLRLIRV